MKSIKSFELHYIIFLIKFNFLHFFLNCHHEGFRHFVPLPLPGHHIPGTQNGGNPQDDLLEKSVENKSFLKLNFTKLLFSKLFSRRSS